MRIELPGLPKIAGILLSAILVVLLPGGSFQFLESLAILAFLAI
jgi:hypothetical protein